VAIVSLAACDGSSSGDDARTGAATGGDTSEPRIVFACQQGQQLDICVTDGNTVRRLTNAPGHDLGPVWSPDGTTVAFECRRPASSLGEGVTLADVLTVGGTAAFAAHRDQGGEICVVGTDGAEERQLTKTRNLAAAPSWSPDGKQLVFARGIATVVASADQLSFVAPGEVHGLFTVSATGGPLRRLTDGEGDDLPAWSPDGDTIAFTTGKGRIALVDASGGGRRSLTSPGNAVDVGASWSPDGEAIAFTRFTLTQYRSGSTIFTGPVRRETWVMRRDGSGQRRLTSSPAFSQTLGGAFRPRWSPDGRTLAVTTVRKTAESAWLDVVLVSVSGDDLRRIGPRTSNPVLIGAFLPSWSPDGRHVSFLSDEDGDFEVYTVGIDGKGMRSLTRDLLEQSDPSWSP
jgi:TolB protein